MEPKTHMPTSLKILVIGATSSNENWNGDCDYATITVNEYLREAVNRRRKIFTEAKSLDDDLLEMYFWDYTPDFITPYLDSYGEFETKFEKMLEDGQTGIEDVWILPGSLQIPETAVQRVECTQMTVRKEGVAWTTIPKHSDVYVTTREIPYNLLI